jgi:hypothetical protein
MADGLMTWHGVEESLPEAGGMYVRPGVYKLLKVRMFRRTDESAKVRVY